MWSARSEELPGGRGLRLEIERDSRPASFAEVIAGWQSDAAFRTLFNSLLAESPFTAFRWETPGVTSDTLSQPFECVLLDSPGLDRRPNPAAFVAHFTDTESSIVTFSNLGGDAILVVPTPLADASAYGHIAAFVRHAPESQRDGLWQAVGEAMAARVGERPVWLSTAGAGVPWLHVRLDDQPKYYGHAPYRTPPPA